MARARMPARLLLGLKLALGALAASMACEAKTPAAATPSKPDSTEPGPTKTPKVKPKPAPAPQPEAPPSPEAQAALAQALELEAQGRLDEADEAAARASQLGMRNAGDLERAKLAIMRERYRDARPLLVGIIERDPTLSDAHYNLALIDQNELNYNASRSGYLRALALNPDLKAARYNLAVLAHKHGVAAEAQHHAQLYAKLDPGSEAARKLLKSVGASQQAPAAVPTVAP